MKFSKVQDLNDGKIHKVSFSNMNSQNKGSFIYQMKQLWDGVQWKSPRKAGTKTLVPASHKGDP
jgi:hypothetical protein